MWFSGLVNDLHPLCLERGEGFLRVRYTMDAFPGLEQSVGSCSIQSQKLLGQIYA